MIRRGLKSLLFAAALGLAAPAHAQAVQPSQPTPAVEAQTSLPDADPALWVVRDEDTTIYLFGTFHMLDGRPWFNDEIRIAFDASDELVIEAITPEDPAAVAALALQAAVDPRGRRLSQRLTAAENERLGRALAEFGLPAAVFDRFEPWYVALTVTVTAVQRAGLAGQHGAETVLSAAARARGMPIGQLESMEFQMRLLDSVPEELQLVQLRGTLDELPRLREIIPPALAAWSRGDVEALDRVLDDPQTSDPRLRRIFLGERNETWARWIRERLERPGAVFVAVGAGHLAGHDSVQTVLARSGVSTERVPRREAP
jgi:uncharacterized protein